METVISEMLIKFINGAGDPSIYSQLMNDMQAAKQTHPQGDYIWQPIVEELAYQFQIKPHLVQVPPTAVNSVSPLVEQQLPMDVEVQQDQFHNPPVAPEQHPAQDPVLGRYERSVSVGNSQHSANSNQPQFQDMRSQSVYNLQNALQETVKVVPVVPVVKPFDLNHPAPYADPGNHPAPYADPGNPAADPIFRPPAQEPGNPLIVICSVCNKSDDAMILSNFPCPKKCIYCLDWAIDNYIKGFKDCPICNAPYSENCLNDLAFQHLTSNRAGEDVQPPQPPREQAV